MKNLGIGVALIMTLTVAAVYAAKGDDEVLRQARDRAEIEDLMWRYTRALDTSNGDAYAAVYAPDGQFSAGTQVTKGRDALKKLAGGNTSQPPAAGQPPRAPMYHMTANHRVTFIDKDHARLEAYYLTAMAAAGETPLRVAAVGRSVDDLVRLDGKWLIKSRNVAPTN
jgi:uncharacterized protein (TIGR02246 family)